MFILILSWYYEFKERKEALKRAKFKTFNLSFSLQLPAGKNNGKTVKCGNFNIAIPALDQKDAEDKLNKYVKAKVEVIINRDANNTTNTGAAYERVTVNNLTAEQQKHVDAIFKEADATFKTVSGSIDKISNSISKFFNSK